MCVRSRLCQVFADMATSELLCLPSLPASSAINGNTTYVLQTRWLYTSQFNYTCGTYLLLTTCLPQTDRHTPTAGYSKGIRGLSSTDTLLVAVNMPLLAPTKGQKNAAKRTAKRQGAPATKEIPSSNVEYTIVGTIEPERLDTPDITITPTQDSAASTQDVTGSPSSGSSPGLSALPLESLGSFNHHFTFAAPTGVATLGEPSNITDISNHIYASSSSKDVEGVEGQRPASLGFSEAFVEDLRNPTFLTAAVSTRAFEEALSRKSDVTESSIFTRLHDATTTTASAPVFIERAGTNVEKKPEVAFDCANQERALVQYCTLKQLVLLWTTKWIRVSMRPAPIFHLRVNFLIGCS